MNEQGSPDLPPGQQDERTPSGGSSFGAGLDAEAQGASTPPTARKKVRRSRKTRTRTRSGDEAEGGGDAAAEGGDDAPASRTGRASQAAADEPATPSRPGRAADDDSPSDRDDRGGDDRGGDDDERPARRPARSRKVRTRSSARTKDDAAPVEERSSRGPVPRGRSGDETADDDEAAGGSFDGPLEGDVGEDGAPRKRRRRGSRGGRRRKKKEGEAAHADEDDSLAESEPRRSTPEGDGADHPEGEAARDGEGDSQKKSKRKRRRRKRGGAKGDVEGEEAEGREPARDRAPAAPSEEGGSKKKKKRKRSRRKKAGAGDDDELEDEAEPEGLSDEERAAQDEKNRVNLLLVNACEPEEKRVALVSPEDRILELMMTAESQKTLVNDIYRGKVVNLEPAIGAAFIDFGQGRNGFLHTSDVLPIYGESGFKLEQLLTASLDPEDWDGALHGEGDVDTSDDEVEAPRGRKKRSRRGARAKDARAEDDDEDADEDDGELEDTAQGDDEREGDEPEAGKKGAGAARGGRGGRGRGAKAQDDKGKRRRGRQRLPISDLLKVGDQVVVQVTKDAIGDKGPTLTTYISIPGRYLVLMPSMARTGVSRKIPDEKERRRLKRILSSLDCPAEMGVIVRTAGVGRTKSDLARDLEYLLGVWETFGKKLKHGRGPAPLYIESDVATRTLRDLFDKQTKEVVVDDPVVHEQMVEFANKLMPENVHRIRLHDGERPVFHHYGIEQDFEKVFARRVELPSGGSIVFDQTEALVAIDINSGRTRTDSHDFEEIALKTNLEAVPEIARQIRLRDLGGILVIDFIDMMKSSSNRAVERALRNELASDKARSKLGRIGQFGLLEMTRQRLGPGTHKKVFVACGRCRGTGKVRSVESRAQAILRRLGSALTQKGFTTVEVRAHPEVVQYLKEDLWDYLRALEHRFEKEVQLSSVPDQVEDSVLRYLRTDGREVRPGGRRKR